MFRCSVESSCAAALTVDLRRGCRPHRSFAPGILAIHPSAASSLLRFLPYAIQALPRLSHFVTHRVQIAGATRFQYSRTPFRLATFPGPWTRYPCYRAASRPPVTPPIQATSRARCDIRPSRACRSLFVIHVRSLLTTGDLAPAASQVTYAYSTIPLVAHFHAHVPTSI